MHYYYYSIIWTREQNSLKFYGHDFDGSVMIQRHQHSQRLFLKNNKKKLLAITSKVVGFFWNAFNWKHLQCLLTFSE